MAHAELVECLRHLGRRSLVVVGGGASVVAAAVVAVVGFAGVVAGSKLLD